MNVTGGTAGHCRGCQKGCPEDVGGDLAMEVSPQDGPEISRNDGDIGGSGGRNFSWDLLIILLNF